MTAHRQASGDRIWTLLAQLLADLVDDRELVEQLLRGGGGGAALRYG